MNQGTDLHNPATKQDLQNLELHFGRTFATKKDLKNIKNVLWNQSLQIEEKLEKLEEKVNYNTLLMNEKLDRLAIVLDQFVGRVDDLTTENQIGTSQTKKLQDKTDNVEKELQYLKHTIKPHHDQRRSIFYSYQISP